MPPVDNLPAAEPSANGPKRPARRTESLSALALPVLATERDTADGVQFMAAADPVSMQAGNGRSARHLSTELKAPAGEAPFSTQLTAWVSLWRALPGKLRRGGAGRSLTASVLPIRWYTVGSRGQRISQPNVCCVCLLPETSTDDPLVFCDELDCDVSVHRGNAGVHPPAPSPGPTVPDLVRSACCFDPHAVRLAACYGLGPASAKRKKWQCDRCAHAEPVVRSRCTCALAWSCKAPTF